MIKELRIDNWIRFYETNSDFEGEVQVIRIEEGDFYAELDYVHPNPQTVVWEPIPLSPEILEKCGFVVGLGEHLWLTVFEGYVHFGFMFNKFPIVLEIDESRMPLHHIHHLHQLQNLYYALTGEELTYKP